MRKLENLKPERVFYYFEELSKIPRESGNERAVCDYLISTAKKLNLEVYQDKTMNVVIKKAATKGYEKSKGVILQGHVDMVCEKTLESSHDFLKDGIDLVIDGDYLRANNTTLGADNGIAIAMALAVLEDKTLEHPQIELLATVEEETTMNGALYLEENILKGELLINIDSEEEAILTAGSAGGKSIEINITENKKELDKNNFSSFKLEVKNLFGGHSGAEIHKNRLNANKILTELLSLVKNSFDIKLSHVEGGSKDNAIPRDAFAKISLSKDMINSFKSGLDKIFKDLENKYKASEENITFNCTEVTDVSSIFSDEFFTNYLNLVSVIPTGVNTWMKEYPDIVESSDNLAIIRTKENKINILTSIRSSEPSVLEELLNKIIAIAKNHKAAYTVSDGYPEWRFRSTSVLRDTAVKTYEKLFNEKMEVTVIHAGLECGAISQHYPNLDMISIGPNIYDVHTPKEKMEIKSVEKYYNYLVELLKNLK